MKGFGDLYFKAILSRSLLILLFCCAGTAVNYMQIAVLICHTVTILGKDAVLVARRVEMLVCAVPCLHCPGN